VSLPRSETAGFGAHQFSPLLTAFAALVAERRLDSEVMPAERTLEILRLLDGIRPAPAARAAAESTAGAPPPVAPAPDDAPASAEGDGPPAAAGEDTGRGDRGSDGENEADSPRTPD
jgi:hypothetical protein